MLIYFTMILQYSRKFDHSFWGNKVYILNFFLSSLKIISFLLISSSKLAEMRKEIEEGHSKELQLNAHFAIAKY